MRNFRFICTLGALLLLPARPGHAAAPAKPLPHSPSTPTVLLKVPMTSEAFAKVPVALVDDEAVTIGELGKALDASHREMAEGKAPPKLNPADIVNRLINVKLFLKEARVIGLDELPEVKTELASHAEQTVRKLILAELAKGAKLNKAEADKLFRDEVKEYKLRSVMFPKEEDAKQMEAAWKAGKTFEELAAGAVKDGKGKDSGEGSFVRHDKLQPELEEAAGKLAAGGVSPPVRIVFQRLPAFVLLRLDDVRYPDDAAARELAEKKALAAAKARAFKVEKDKLLKAQVKTHKKIVDSLDFEAPKPGIEALTADKRVLVEIKGEKPITVGELSTKVKESFYHGLENAAKEKRLNRKKNDLLDELVEKRLFSAFSRKKGYEKTDTFHEMMKDHEAAVLFTAFVNKAVVPDVKVTDEDALAYYREHGGDFAYPEMVRMRSLAFDTPAQAQAALEKLQKGADFSWTRANSEGRLDEVERGLLAFDGTPLMVTGLPPELREAISGAKPGDVRLFHYNDASYVLAVAEQVAPQARPFGEVKDEIGQKLFGLKFQEAVDGWAGKLRAASKVESYLAEPSKQEVK